MTDRTPAEVIAELRKDCTSLPYKLVQASFHAQAIPALLAIAEAAVAVDAVWRDGTRVELDWALETLNDALSNLTRKL